MKILINWTSNRYNPPKLIVFIPFFLPGITRKVLESSKSGISSFWSVMIGDQSIAGLLDILQVHSKLKKQILTREICKIKYTYKTQNAWVINKIVVTCIRGDGEAEKKRSGTNFCIHVMKLLSSLSIFILIIVTTPPVKAQEVFLSGSRSQALAGISVGVQDCWSIFGNQAGLAKTDRLTIGGGFQNRFWIKELSVRSGFVILPVNSSVFAISVYQFGQTAFRDEKLGIAYARSLNPNLKVGIQFNYYRLFLAEENRSLGSYGVEFGFQYQLTNAILMGIHALNPYQTNLQTSTGQYSYPSRIGVGATFQLSDSFAFLTEIQKDFKYPLLFKTGLEYDVMNKLFIRTGLSAKPYQLSAGMGFAVKNMTIDLAVAYNQSLGNSPSVSFQYQF